MNNVMKWVWLNGRFASCHAHLKDIHSIVLLLQLLSTCPLAMLRPLWPHPLCKLPHLYTWAHIYKYGQHGTGM